MKKLALLTLFLCLSFSFAGFADAETENWCGTYFEEGGRGYIRLARDDFGVGSSNCSMDGYRKYRPGFYQKPFYSQQMAQIQQPSD